MNQLSVHLERSENEDYRWSDGVMKITPKDYRWSEIIKDRN